MVWKEELRIGVLVVVFCVSQRSLCVCVCVCCVLQSFFDGDDEDGWHIICDNKSSKQQHRAQGGNKEPPPLTSTRFTDLL